jgi:tRNA(Ile)-lysidine synthase
MELINIAENELRAVFSLESFRTIVVAVSGGADSVVLMDLLEKLQDKFSYQLVVAHVHHGLRGETADRDANAVERLANHYGCAFEYRRVNVLEEIKRTGESVETAARRLRYQSLFEINGNYEHSLVATAHHQNDQAETILDRMLRGTGSQGLAGILPFRSISGVQVIRPLLGVPKKRLLEYARKVALPFEEDETNTWLRYRRNRIRHELIPYLAEFFNPSIVKTLSTEAEIFRAENELLAKWTMDFVSSSVKLVGQQAVFQQETYLLLPIALQRRVVKLVLEYIDYEIPYGFDDIEVVRLFLLQGRGRCTLKGGHVLVVQHATLEVMKEEQNEYVSAMRWTPTTVDRASFFSVRGLKWQVESTVEPSPREFSRTLWDAWFSLEDQPLLTLRGWQQGDRMKLYGMSGSKLLSDVFIDNKVARAWRRMYPIFAIGQEIVWVPGLARSRMNLLRENLPYALRVSVRPAMED